MPRLKGADFLTLSRILWPKTPVIVVSNHAVLLPGDFLEEPSHGSINRMGRRNCCRFSKRLYKQQLIGTGNNPSPQHYCHDHVLSHSSIIGVKFVDPVSLSNQSDDRSVAGRSPNSGPSLGRVSIVNHGPAG